MKILNLKILNPSDEVIRNIDFNKKGISFIYGDIQEPKNKKATINSLGKTLLLKFVDYILGAKEDSKVVSGELKGYQLHAVVLFHSKEYKVIRNIGDSKSILVDGKEYSLTDYKEFFQINRVLYSKQIILSKKSTEISFGTSPIETDVVACLELLGLKDIVSTIEGIYTAQDKIKDLKKQKKQMIELYGNWNEGQIDEEIYYVDKEVSRLQNELQSVSDKIKDMAISEIQQDVVEEYAEKSKKLKYIKRDYENKRIECERLVEFMESSQKNDVTSEHLLLIFEKVKQEIPEMVKRNLVEVEEFHRKVYEERKEFLGERKKVLEKEMDVLQGELEELSEKLDSLGKIIAINEIYQESIQLYDKYNADLQGLIYKQGKLSQVKEFQNEIENVLGNLDDYFGEAAQIRKLYENKVKEYRDFIYKLTQDIYDEDVNSYFDIKMKKKHLKNRPLSFEFSLKGDTGEGVGEVKKNLMDYLICKYSSIVEMLLQDSSCYNGIDPRQVTGMLKAIGNIANEVDKQVIIAINKYQLGEYEDCIDYVVKNNVITLSEKDKLLKFDF